MRSHPPQTTVRLVHSRWGRGYSVATVTASPGESPGHFLRRVAAALRAVADQVEDQITEKDQA